LTLLINFKVFEALYSHYVYAYMP